MFMHTLTLIQYLLAPFNEVKGFLRRFKEKPSHSMRIAEFRKKKLKRTECPSQLTIRRRNDGDNYVRIVHCCPAQTSAHRTSNRLLLQQLFPQICQN